MAGGSSTRFSSEAHLRIGRWLRSKWHLDSLIAIGGMASVYAGTHRNGARAAIKVLHAQYTRNDQARRRFLAEGYAANKVGHRNAVSVLDDDTTEDGEVYLVMELLDGESFEGRLERVGVMNPIEVLRITDQMLEVLSAAHNRGILHRDIKPANIYLCRDGSVKLLDFGLARVRELSAEALDQSDGIVFGTVSYIAPEQARADNQNLDARSDMWSVAATMFRALTGETVFPAEGPVIERLLAVARKPARSIATVNPRLPRPVIELIDRTLAFNPEDRWPSANVMRAVVQDVVAQLEEDAAAAAEAEQHAPLFSHRSEYNPPSPSPSPVPQSQRPRGEPTPQQSPRPRTDPPQAGKQEPMARPTPQVRPEASPTPVPRDESFDEIDLDVENMTEPRPGKRARTRTLLTKEGRAELRRILDARRESLGIPGGKAEPTPEPVQVAAPVKPEPAAVQPRTRPTTEPSPTATVQPRTRPTTEPSPTASVQPGQRGGPSHEPSASDSFLGADLLIEEASMMQSGLVVLQPEEPSMMESGLVVLQPDESATLQPEPPPQSEPEESIIEVMIQHTRSEAVGTIAEPIGEPPARPGPGDSMTTAAFPAIGGPRPATPAARPPGQASPESAERAPEAAKPTAPSPAIGGPPAKATASYPTIGAPSAKTTASYPTIGTPPAKSTASYPAVGSPPATAKPTPARGEAPTRSEETKIGPAPLAPTRSSSPDITKVGPAPLAPTSARPEAAKPASEPAKAAAVPATPSGAARHEEPASEMSKSARGPLPTFGRPGAPAATPTNTGLPGPLPSRSSQSDATRASQAPVSGEIGEARGQASSSGRWAPPGGQLPTRPSGETRPTNVTTGATRPIDAPTSSTPAKVEAPVKPSEPASAARPAAPPSETASAARSAAPPSETASAARSAAPTPGKPIEAPVSPTRSTSDAKAEARPTAKPVEGVKPAPGGPAKAGDTRPSTSVAATKASEAGASRPVEPAKPADNKPTVTTKSGETKAATKPVEAKPVEAKPAVKSGDVKPAPTSEAKGSARPGAAKPGDVRPATKPVEARAASDEAAAIKQKSVEPASARTEVRPAETKLEEAKPEPLKEEAPAKQDEPTPDPLRLPGSGLSRPAPTKSVFAVPYANLGKPSERGEAKPAGKSEPDPTRPKKPG